MGDVFVDYFADLWARRSEAMTPAQRDIHYSDGSTPQSAQCHANVDRWVGEHPGRHAIRGWLAIIQPGAESGLFVRHSIAADGGQCVEITLKEPLPFLVHQGSAELWMATQGLNQIIWPPSTEADPFVMETEGPPTTALLMEGKLRL